MKKLLKKLGISVLIGLFLYSCTEDYFEFDKIRTDEWRPELAVPLINTSLTLEDIVIRNDSNGLFNTNSDGILEISYENNVINTFGNRAYEVPTQRFGDTISQVVPPFNPGTPLTIPFATEIVIEDTANFGVVIDSMILNEGRLAFTIENEYPYDIDITAKFRTFTDSNGDTLELTYNVPAAASPSMPQVRSEEVDLTGFQINLTEDANGNPAVNTLPIDAQVTVMLQSGVGAVSGEELRLIGAISDIQYKEFYGYLGNSTRELEKDTFAVELFRNFTTSDFFISNPFLNVTVTNSFAVPIEFNFLFLNAINTEKNQTLPFSIPPTLQPLVLNFPQQYGKEITNVQLDRTNSNLDSVVSFLLNEVAFDSEIQFNPNGVPPPGQPRNFLSDTSDLELNVEFRIPFEGRAAGFFIEDTIDFNFELADDLDNGLIRVIAENGFPMGVKFQLTFLDDLNNKIDSLFPMGDSSLVNPSITDNDGNLIQEARKLTDISISGERLQNLTLGRKVAIRAQLSTADVGSGRNVKFRPEYRLELAVGLRANILID